jgi:hypothetical protein
MMNALKGTLAIGILVLIVVFSADAFAQWPGWFSNLTVDDWGTIGTDLDVGHDLNVGNDATIDDDLWVSDWLVGYGSASLNYDLLVGNDLDVYNDLQVWGNTFVDDIFGDLAWFGKIVSNGGYDPPYVLYDKQTRDQIVDMVTRELLPGKEVCTRLSPVCNKYVVRKGVALDTKTGEFVNKTTGCVIPREEALAIYVPKDQKYYDLQGNLIRSETSEKEIEYRTEYYFDKLTGDVTPMRKAVRDIFVIRKGFTFNKKTGEFVDEATGEAVPKEMAIEVKEAS